MSFFTVKCPWCGALYTTGVVGSTPVGSGHSCKAQRPCDHDGCSEDSTYAVYTSHRGAESFRCGEHVEGTKIYMARPGAFV